MIFILTIASGSLLQMEAKLIQVKAWAPLVIQEPEEPEAAEMVPSHAGHGHGWHHRDRSAPERGTNGGGLNDHTDIQQGSGFITCTAACI